MHIVDFNPAVYEHAARLIGKTPWQTSRDAELLFQAHATAFRLYRHSPVIVGIDIYNLEAEAYGARVDEPQGHGLPAITRHPCASMREVVRLDPSALTGAGRIPMVLAVGARLQQELPETKVSVPVSGPFSLACNLVGFETLLCEAMMDPEGVKRGLFHLVEGQKAFCAAIRERGLGVSIFESAATPPLLSPELFAEVEYPALTHLVETTSELLGYSASCIVGGDTAPIAEMLFRTGAGYVICPSETDQAAFMTVACRYPEVLVRVNMDPWTLVHGDEAAVQQEVQRVAELARSRPRTCIGTGVLPYEAEPEVVLRLKEYVASL